MKFSIYGLLDPVTKAIRYVGKTVIALNARKSNHEYKARSGRTTTPVGAWVRSLQAKGLRPDIKLLEESEGDWQVVERAWISRLQADGHVLLNVSKGGNGAHTRAPLAPKFVKLLGTISDGEIGQMAGLCRESITYHRRQLRIAKAPFDETHRRGTFKKGQDAHNKTTLPKEVLTRLGAVGDRELAAEAGVSRNVIRARRIELGIRPYTRRRFARGAEHWKSQLTLAQVLEARASYVPRSKTHGIPALAKKYGVCAATLYDAVTGKTWRG